MASLLDIAISPDAFEPWPYDYQTMLTWALVPASDEALKMMIVRGRKDAHVWARRMRLIPGEPPEAGEASSSAGSGSGSGSESGSEAGGGELRTSATVGAGSGGRTADPA